MIVTGDHTPLGVIAVNIYVLGVVEIFTVIFTAV
jgi:hypothetical protein